MCALFRDVFMTDMFIHSKYNCKSKNIFEMINELLLIKLITADENNFPCN